MKLEFFKYKLELKEKFTISHTSREFQETLIVAISEGDYTGYGEATATSYYGVSVEQMISAIKKVESIVEENIQRSPEVIWELTYPILKEDLFAQCALDIALHDLHGKRNTIPLYKMWGLKLKGLPLSNYTIGIDSVEKMTAKIKDFPWPLYKIKLGTKEDVQIIKELRKHTNSVFRVDANGAWSAEETVLNSELLKVLNVEFIEQPLAPNMEHEMKEVFEKSALPIIADESCLVETDVVKCSRIFHGINIKLTKCGGLTPAKRMITEARKRNLKVMMGCMTESSVGISAIAQLLPLLDYVDMDGALLLKNDIANGVKIKNGKAEFPKRNGTGVELL
ncbi:dipeptide epimerase [Gillisia marina]|uniref:dipeptide epimerase n=1 Tax=Gillisia marina TaxID=1167637 RepID=UPI000299DBD4|nr:dipeptide epimerase [Gillisia marina]